MSIKPQMQLVFRRSCGAVLALLGVGCLELQTGEPTGDRTCVACHGDMQRAGDRVAKSAPPLDLDGHTATTEKGVGAHQRHLSTTGHAPVACAQCHVVPETVFSPGHVDSEAPAEVLFGTLAMQAERQPAYDRKTGNCSDTYCHRGATVSWTSARSEREACGTCHALPPPAPHPQKELCSSCHGNVVDQNRNFVAPKLHVNGRVELNIGDKCNTCHGTDPANGAPPPDLAGNMQPSARGVGAHANHLSDTATHLAVACNECHIVPTAVDSPGHNTGADRAPINFGTLAQAKNSSPIYFPDTATCSNTYCHGANTGSWQAPRDSEAACGRCHGLPPPLPHLQLNDCSLCHGRVVGPDGKIKQPSLHVNGTVEIDYNAGCASCHGTGTDGGPPPDLHGNTDSSARGVGAHAQHLTAGPTHAAVTCSTCHHVPAKVEEPAHLDGDNNAEVTFSSLALANGYQPTYDSATAGCSRTFCHRESKPVWQAPRSSADACGSCHALPPPAPHPQTSDCSQCHGNVIDAKRNFTAPELHVNGRVELLGSLPCNGCHGTDPNGGPPSDTAGNMSTSARGVGAHAAHLQASATHAAVTCNACHSVPLVLDAPGHVDTLLPAEVTFGTLAKTNGAVPNYSATDLTCSGSYCHGNATPNWVAPRSSTDACGSCHALPPPYPHPQKSDCSQCHGTVVDATSRFIAPELHVNGRVDVSALACNSCHGTDPNGDPPPDTSGNTATSARGVGAHAAHLQASATHAAVACNACHVVPLASDAPGHTDSALPAEVTFGSLAKANGSVPIYSAATLSCSGNYCHRSASPNWTAPRTSAQACGSCHGLPPPAPHPQSSLCSLCHGAVIDGQLAFVRAELHVDGQVQVVQNCTACHGSPANAAPPTDTSGSSDPTHIGVGAHQIHLSGGSYSRPLSCGECHNIPATVEAFGHLDVGATTPADVVFTGPAAVDGRNPQWDHTSTTCSGSWCHGPLDPLNLSSSWVATPGNLTCTSCHGMPPAPPHTTNTQCNLCHGDVDPQHRITDRSLHVNGEVDFL